MRPDVLAQAVGDAIAAAVRPLQQEVERLRAALAAAEARSARDREAIRALQQRESPYAEPVDVR